VVLDLDETLVHTHVEPEAYHDFTIHISGHEDLFVIVRPGLSDFFAWLKRPLIDVVVFTAGSESYAQAVVEHLDPDGVVIRQLLSRCMCTPTPLKDAFCKDLGKLTNDMSRTILVDNSPLSCMLQPENALLVDDWYGVDPNDCELERVRQVLEACLFADDVRQVLPRYCPRIQPIINSIFLDNWMHISLSKCSISTSTTSLSKGILEYTYPWTSCGCCAQKPQFKRNDLVVSQPVCGSRSSWSRNGSFNDEPAESDYTEEEFDVDELLGHEETSALGTCGEDPPPFLQELMDRHKKIFEENFSTSIDGMGSLPLACTREDPRSGTPKDSLIFRSPPPIIYSVPRRRAVACKGDSGDVSMPSDWPSQDSDADSHADVASLEDAHVSEGPARKLDDDSIFSCLGSDRGFSEKTLDASSFSHAAGETCTDVLELSDDVPDVTLVHVHVEDRLDV